MKSHESEKQPLIFFFFFFFVLGGRKAAKRHKGKGNAAKPSGQKSRLHSSAQHGRAWGKAVPRSSTVLLEAEVEEIPELGSRGTGKSRVLAYCEQREKRRGGGC